MGGESVHWAVAAAGSDPAATLAVVLAVWHSYEFSRVVFGHRKSSSVVCVVSHRMKEVAMRIFEFVMSAASAVVGWSHAVAAE